VLQFFWIYYHYNITNQHYQKIVGLALNETCQDYTQWKVSIFQSQSKKRVYSLGYSAGLEASRKGKLAEGTIPKMGPDTIQLDSVLPGRFQLLLRLERANPFAFEKNIFDSLFSLQLKKESINARYVIDTFHLGERFSATVGPETLRPGFSFLTKNYRLNIFSTIAVGASVRLSKHFIISKLALLLVLSLIVFISGNLILYYFFKKLGKQRKLQEIKDEFISNITHEIKTPISVVNSAVDNLLFHGGLTSQEKTLKYLSISKRELEHLDGLVDKLMDMAVEVEDFSDSKVLVYISHLIQSVIEKNQLLHGYRLSISYRILIEEKPILVNKTHIANAINNLVENAIKYGGENVQIDLESSVNAEQCVISVRDNGRGIPIRYRNQIFEKFFRVPDSIYKRGYGLGLFYVKKVVESHKGDISMNSRVGEGTQFIIHLPTHS
jgi:signal transduction histidine kinase